MRTNRPNQGKFESWVSGHSATDHPCALQRQACFWLAPPRTAGGFFYPHLNFPGSSCHTFSEPIPQWLFFYFLAFSWLVSGHPTSRLKDGVKVSTSACCGGWSQSLNIRKMTHYYYWRSIKRKKRLTWIEWSCSRCSPFSFPSPLSKISVKAQWLPLICSQADSFLAYITVRSSEKQRYRFH